MKVIKCVMYFAIIGVLWFAIGRVLPKKLFHAERFPFRAYDFEANGNIYEKLKVKSWQKSVPDMCRLFPKFLPQKAIRKRPDKNTLELMIQETCIAEFVHVMLAFLGFGALAIWRKTGGLIVSTLYFLANIPFIIIQRYERPRLIKLMSSFR